MVLSGDSLDIHWPRAASQPFFKNLTATMKAVAHVHGARYVPNPLAFLRRTITVHPLGGCPMGRDAKRGVVDAHGEVFGYPGLTIADGSVMCGPVGANPSLTIAALADRFAERAIDKARPRIGSTGAGS